MNRNEIYALINEERNRQNKLHPGWPWDTDGPLVFSERYAVLSEEHQEVGMAYTPENLMEELVQCAAVCVRWLERLP